MTLTKIHLSICPCYRTATSAQNSNYSIDKNPNFLQKEITCRQFEELTIFGLQLRRIDYFLFFILLSNFWGKIFELTLILKQSFTPICHSSDFFQKQQTLLLIIILIVIKVKSFLIIILNMTDRGQLPKESQIKLKQQAGISCDPALWYYSIFQNRNKFKKAPTSIPTYKQSHPYRIAVNKLQGLSLSKKSGSSDLFLQIDGIMFTQGFNIIGAPFHYQFQTSFGRDNRWDTPMVLYLHSRIDKNYEGLYLLIKYSVIEMKDSFIQSSIDIGTLVIKNPFIEESNKILPVYRDLNEIQFGYSSPETRAKILAGSSQLTAQYSAQSMLQLKKLVKLIPQNAIFTHQDHITGISGDFLPKELDEVQIQDAKVVQITISYLQVHLSDRFQQDLLAFFKKNYPSDKGLDIKNRKFVIGFHNQYQIVNPVSRKLELIDKQTAGQTRILLFQGLKQGQVLKIPFFFENETSLGMMTVGLIYEIGAKDVQLACSYFLPQQNGDEINEQMKIGAILGSTYQLIPFPTNELPTLIRKKYVYVVEYSCDIKDLTNPYRQQGFGSTKDLKAKSYINQELVAQERQRLKQEIEKERIQLMKEKQQMQKLRLQKDIHYQAQFQKKFEVQKDNLYKRQQMIENQYKEQVERQIRQKFQLEQQVKKMIERIQNLQENNMKKTPGEGSYQSSRGDHIPVQRGENQQLTTANMLPIRQRMDPGYLIEPQNTIPVKKVREIMERTPKVNAQIVKISQEQFNQASRFTLTFTSIIWSEIIDVPQSIYLLVRFFNQKQFRTENLGYLEQGEGGYHRLIKFTHYNRGLQDTQASYCFTIDPSEYHQPAILQKDLTHYLYNNNAIIDVFSGDTHLYIGQLNIKLRDLLRGNKSQTLIAKQLNLVKIKNKEVLGVIQVLIKNQKMPCKEEVSIKHQKKVKDFKKKIVSNNPLHITAQDRHLQTNPKIDKQIEQIRNKNFNINRQQLRIQKFKQQKSSNSFASTANNFAHLDQTEKGLVLGQITIYKEKKIQDFLKGAYQSLLNEKIIISAYYGRAVTFPFLFTNTSQAPSSYRVTIMHAESENLKELFVVKSNKQWRYLTNKHKYAEPKRYDMIGENNSFFLQSGESIPIIFKFISFQKEQMKVGQLLTKEKMINITICKEDNNWIAGGFSLLVNMHQQIIHHSYILYEPGDQIVDLIVPVIYSQTENNSNTKKLYLTNQDPSTSAVWLNSYQILVRIPTPKIMQKLKFNLLLYEDEFFCQLSQNWLIEVYAYEGVCTTFRSDFNTRFKITLPWSAVPAHLGLLSFDRASSCLNLYASNSGLIFKDNIIELESDRKDHGSYEIWCEIIGSENTLKNFEITCISRDEGELIYGWVVTVYPYLPRN